MRMERNYGNLLHRLVSFKTFVLGHQALIVNMYIHFRQGGLILYPVEYLFTQKQNHSVWKEGPYPEFSENILT